jgi:hypothetical protein
MLVFGLGTAELIILAAIGSAFCLPVVIGIVVVVIISTQRPRE